MGFDDWTAASLWLAVVGSGIYHGINPGMGWPLAVSAALMERRRGALPRALGALAAGHFLAMVAILLPFAAMTSLVAWEREIRAGAALVVIGFGVWLLIYRRHPRFLARIPMIPSMTKAAIVRSSSSWWVLTKCWEPYNHSSSLPNQTR